MEWTTWQLGWRSHRPRRPREDPVQIVDGSLVPTRDRSISASSRNYRYSTNLQVVIDANSRPGVLSRDNGVGVLAGRADESTSSGVTPTGSFTFGAGTLGTVSTRAARLDVQLTVVPSARTHGAARDRRRHGCGSRPRRPTAPLPPKVAQPVRVLRRQCHKITGHRRGRRRTLAACSKRRSGTAMLPSAMTRPAQACSRPSSWGRPWTASLSSQAAEQRLSSPSGPAGWPYRSSSEESLSLVSSCRFRWSINCEPRRTKRPSP